MGLPYLFFSPIKVSYNFVDLAISIACLVMYFFFLSLYWIHKVGSVVLSSLGLMSFG